MSPGVQGSVTWVCERCRKTPRHARQTSSAAVKLIDPATTVTVPGEGTWSVDPTTGDVTFTPEDGFTGDPTSSTYTVVDANGVRSNPATITVMAEDKAGPGDHGAAPTNPVPPSGPSELANTGVDVDGMALTGGFLVVLGAIVWAGVWIGRRRITS